MTLAISAVPLSLLGLSLVIVGSVLLYIFHDPATGNSLLLEGVNLGRQKLWARVGLVLVIVGGGLQLAAVLL